jgi:hypothetical protein
MGTINEINRILNEWKRNRHQYQSFDEIKYYRSVKIEKKISAKLRSGKRLLETFNKMKRNNQKAFVSYCRKWISLQRDFTVTFLRRGRKENPQKETQHNKQTWGCITKRYESSISSDIWFISEHDRTYMIICELNLFLCTSYSRHKPNLSVHTLWSFIRVLKHTKNNHKIYLS